MNDHDTYRMMEGILEEGGATRDLLRRSNRSFLSWEQYVASRLPPGLTPLECWDLLQTVNHAAGIDLPIPDLAGNRYWYLRTQEIADTVSRLQCLCRSDSSLYTELTTTQNRRVLVQSRIDETVAAAYLDGLDISEERGSELLHSHRTPRDNTERVVLNTLTAMERVSELVNEPFSKELLYELRRWLLEGLDVSVWQTVPRRMGLMTSDYRDEQVLEASDRQIQYMCDYANHVTGDLHDHPVLRALLLVDMFRYYRPLPCMNSQVGRLAFRLYALKAGLPVLGMLSLSRTKLDWEDKKLASSLVAMGPDQYAEARRHSGTDLTAYMTLVSQMALDSLGDLMAQIRALEHQDSELRALLQVDQRLNHRQRSVLGRALRNPDSEFRIANHRVTHSVVYATARADLLDLVERGYLEMVKRGRAFVFVPKAGMRALLERDEGVEAGGAE